MALINIFLGVIELTAFLASLFFIYEWVVDPKGNYELWKSLVGLVFVAAELIRRYLLPLIKEKKKLTPGELVRHSESLREKLQEEIYRCRANKLRRDVIIRDIDRMDLYPDAPEKKKGPSSWFRAGLLDTYHRGILVGLAYGALSEGPDGYRFPDYQEGEDGDKKVYLVCKIPFKHIEGVNLEGDEYYSFPHIFCYFSNNGSPCEERIFCEEIEINEGHFYYKEIAKHDQVAENSTLWGGDYFG